MRFLFALILFPLYSIGQTFNWVLPLHFSETHSIETIKVDSKGNTYLFGFFSRKSENSTASYGAFIAKIDSTGTFAWMTFDSATNMKGGVLDELERPVSLSTNAIRYFNPNTGNIEKTIQFNWGISGARSQLQGFDIDSNGDIYYIGYFSKDTLIIGSTILQNSSWSRYFYGKIDKHGSFLWAKQAQSGEPGDSELKLEACKDGFYVVSSVLDSLKIENQIVPNSCCGNMAFIARFDKNGNLSWLKKTTSQIIKDIAVDKENNLYSIGTTSGSGSVTIDSETVPFHGYIDILIEKFDSTGVCKWIKNPSGVGRDMGLGVSVDSNGNCFISGVFDGEAYFDQVSLINSGYTEPFIAKLDSNGKTVWALKTGGGGFGKSICVSNEAVYTAGLFAGTMDFFGNPKQAINGDIFVLNLSNLNISSTNELLKEDELTLYPNPTHGKVTIELLSESKYLQVYNSLGEQILNKSLSEQSEIEIDLSGNATGVYFVKILTGSKVKTVRVALN